MAKKKTSPKPAPAPDPVPGKVVGKTISRARSMTAAELEAEGWETGRHGPPVVLVLSDGTKLYPSRDEEGNGPGAMFGVGADGQSFALCGQE